MLTLDTIKAFILHSFASVVNFDNNKSLDLTCKIPLQYSDASITNHTSKRQQMAKEKEKLNLNIQIRKSKRSPQEDTISYLNPTVQ